ncbi:hypothetical protein AHAS_Ahas09G0150400 [Arachis hypogaea]
MPNKYCNVHTGKRLWILNLKSCNSATCGPWSLHLKCNTIGYIWIFAIKKSNKREIMRYRVRLVGKGFHEQKRVDYD